MCILRQDLNLTDPTGKDSYGTVPKNSYQCAYYVKTFSQSADKTCHEWAHTKKQYQCTLYDKIFTQSGDKNRHERILTYGKPYGYMYVHIVLKPSLSKVIRPVMKRFIPKKNHL